MWPQIIITSGKGEMSLARIGSGKEKMCEEKSKTSRKKETAALTEREIFAELDALVGLRSVKEMLREVYAFWEIQKYRKKARLASEPMVFHMIFSGNPGTGKTTVARILGRMLKQIGVIESGHIVEAERADLVGEYIGHTAQKTREKVKKAFGGVLFIDEAYSLARGGEKDFGKESIDVLVKAMEDHKNDFILVLAGYPSEMESFLAANPGLCSRFPTHLSFEDYTEQELLKIADLFCEKKEYRLSERARKRLGELVMAQRYGRESVFGNARAVRNLVEKAIRRQATRLLGKPNLLRQDLLLLEECDFIMK
ncbi:MAG: AAA family ATPase [Selenomonadales bacterium]|nr:AAA family ATPase [Selenomonadales bacterium]